MLNSRSLKSSVALGILFFESFCSFSLTQAAEPEPVRWEEIQEWKNLGPRWEGGLDASGHLIAIYDLSYPDLTQRTYLGSLNIALELSSVWVNYLAGFIPIPLIGPLIAKVYHAIVINPMHASQYWESRLEAHLIGLSSLGQNWKQEIDILDQQKINPFELSQDQVDSLIHLRKKEFHLP